MGINGQKWLLRDRWQVLKFECQQTDLTMKKNLLAILMLVISVNLCQAQRYGYASTKIVENGQKYLYISLIKDLSTLSCPDVSNTTSYGTEKSQLGFAEDCIRKWFNNLLNDYGIIPESEWDTYSHVRTPNQYASCTYGNESACFMDRTTVENARQETILNFTADGYSVLEIP